MSEKNKITITFNEDSFNEIKEILGLKNIRCKFCKQKITKKNIAGIFGHPKKVFCRNTCCSLGYLEEDIKDLEEGK